MADYKLSHSAQQIDTATGRAIQMTDWMVQGGTSGMWRYRKWFNGTAEVWGYAETSDSMDIVDGAMFRGVRHYNTFPDGLFKTLTNCMISADGGAFLYYGTSSSAERTQDYYFYSPFKISDTKKFFVYIHAFGTWK